MEGHGFLSLYGNIICMFNVISRSLIPKWRSYTEHGRLQCYIWTPLVFPRARSTPGCSHPRLPKSSSRHRCLDRHVSKGLTSSLLGPQCLAQCQDHHNHSVHTCWMNECWMNSSVSQTCRKKFINSMWQVKDPLTFLHLLDWESMPLINLPSSPWESHFEWWKDPRAGSLDPWILMLAQPSQGVWLRAKMRYIVSGDLGFLQGKIRE